MNGYLVTLREMREKALQGGDAERVQQLHARGAQAACSCALPAMSGHNRL
ncbi:MAG: hypothetical protein M1434_11555 [Chloroflexi bacterium]|nr:hypothetical protein [Chloroflexota bacterium]MCL5275358.1 hypothetical protein [Chloroflexota bacterium]